MKTAGEILAAARKKKGWTIEKLGLKTKIQHKYLKAIEISDFSHLPKTPFINGLIKTIAYELGLDPDGIAAIFRRDFRINEEIGIIPKSLQKKRKDIGWTPKLTAAAAIAIIIISFLGYLSWQLLALTSRPLLIITQPSDGAVIGSEVTIEGKTDPAAAVTVNDQEILKNKDGSFIQILSLTPGKYTITVMAVGNNGKKTTEQRTIRIK